MRARRLMTLLLGVAAGCTFDSRVGEAVAVTCSADSLACPRPLVCRLTVGRCVDPTQVTTEPLVLDRSVLSPPLARAGTVVTLSLSSSRPLSKLPRVRIAPAASAAFDAFTTGTLLTPYDAELTFTTQGTEPEGTHAVVAELVDQSGVQASGLSAGNLTLDFTAPRLAPGASVVLEPPPDSPVTRVSALGLGGSATVSFAFSEPLLAPPEVGCEVAGGPLPFAQVGTSTTPWTFRAAGAPGLEGDCQLVAKASDLAGNLADVPVMLSPELRVDTTPPAPPDVETARRVVLWRAPWGRDSVRPPAVELTGAAGAVEPGGLLLVLAEPPDGGRRAELGRGTADDAGAVSAVDLGALDRPSAWVQAVDSAGNLSAAAPVHDVSYIGSLEGRLPNGASGNPNRYEARAVASPAQRRFDVRERAGAELGQQLAAAPVTGGASWVRYGARGPANLGTTLSCFTSTSDSRIFYGSGGSLSTWDPERERWSPATLFDLENDGNPVQRGYVQPAWDRRRGTGVLFGGRAFGSGLRLDDTWTFDGRSWFRQSPAHAPQARASAALAWNEQRQQVMLVGGLGFDGGFLHDTWEWSGTDWVQRSAAGAPSTLQGAMTWVPDAGALQVYGLDSDGGGGLWAWADDSSQWRKVQATPQLSPVTFDRPLALLIHPATGERLLVADVSNQTVVWRTASDGGWTSVSQSLPGGQLRNVCVEPSVRQVLLLTTTDTYELLPDGGARRAHTALGFRPGPRNRAALAYDQSTGLTMVHGGIGVTGDTGDSRWWDGENYSTRTEPQLPAGSPAAIERWLVTDPASGQVWLHRCRANVDQSPDGGELWRWQADAGLSLVGLGPCLAHAVAAWDPSRGAVVLAGGTTGLFTGTAVALRDQVFFYFPDGGVQSGPALPVPMAGLSLAWHPTKGALMAWGGLRGDGQVHDEALLLTDAGWVTMPQAGLVPPERESAPMVTDPFRNELVLFGGQQSLVSGGVWSVRFPFGDVWHLRADVWRQPEINDPEGDGNMGPLGEHALAYQPVGRFVTTFGGTTNGGTKASVAQTPGVGDMADYVVLPHRPAAAVHFVAPQGAEQARQLGTLTVHLSASGLGESTTGLPLSGAELQVWLDGHWQTVGPVPAGAATLMVDLSAVTPKALFQDLGLLSLQVVALGRNGTGWASLQLDDLWVQLDYR